MRKQSDLTISYCCKEKKRVRPITISRQEIGRLGEIAAAEYLEKNGYDIIERNWRCRSGEIDLIAKKAKQYIFVEVRTRRRSKYDEGKASLSFGTPFESVDLRKQYQVRQVASVFLHQRKLRDVPLRFDVISVLLDQAKRAKCEHLPAAF